MATAVTLHLNGLLYIRLLIIHEEPWRRTVGPQAASQRLGLELDMES